MSMEISSASRHLRSRLPRQAQCTLDKVVTLARARALAANYPQLGMVAKVNLARICAEGELSEGGDDVYCQSGGEGKNVSCKSGEESGSDQAGGEGDSEFLQAELAQPGGGEGFAGEHMIGRSVRGEGEAEGKSLHCVQLFLFLFSCVLLLTALYAATVTLSLCSRSVMMCPSRGSFSLTSLTTSLMVVDGACDTRDMCCCVGVCYDDPVENCFPFTCASAGKLPPATRGRDSAPSPVSSPKYSSTSSTSSSSTTPVSTTAVSAPINSPDLPPPTLGANDNQGKFLCNTAFL